MENKKAKAKAGASARYRRDDARAKSAESIMISKGCTQRSSEVYARLCYVNGWPMWEAINETLATVKIRRGGTQDFARAAETTDRRLNADKGARRLLSESETTCGRCKGKTVLVSMSEIHPREEGSTMYCRACDLPAGLVIL